MPAYDYEDLGAMLLNIRWQLEATPLLTAIDVLIEGYRLANPSLMAVPIDEPTRNEILKRLTGCVVATETNVNCYPLGLETAILFNPDGTPVT